MKTKSYILFLAALLAVVVSCKDESLDPLQFEKVKKGTILALRGTQLNNIYVKGVPGAEVFPKIATGAEKFVFEGEYLSADPTSLASVDVYVIKGSGTNTSRVLMKNVPFSEFKNDGKYPKPYVSISLDFPDVLSKLGLTNTFPLSAATINTLLTTTYKFGINIECDLNLTDGSKVLASDIIAAGLFQSNQFYPAMRLNWAMTDYCAYVENDWSGQWFGDEVGTGVSSPPGGDNLGVFVKIAPHTWRMDNFFGDGAGVYAVIKFSPSSDPSTQIVTYLNDPGKSYQQNVEGQISGSGTYDQCLGKFSLNTTYVIGTSTYKWRYDIHR